MSIKSEIIQNFLFKEVKDLLSISKEYTYLRITDSNMVNDDEMYIYIDCKYKEDDFNNKKIFELCLDDFEKECKKFLYDIDDNILSEVKYLIYSETYHTHHKNFDDGKEYFDCCELHFWICENL